MVRNDIKISSNRIVVFIDGSNINCTMKELGWNIDWNKLQDFEKEDNTKGSQELACTAGVCELVDI